MSLDEHLTDAVGFLRSASDALADAADSLDQAHRGELYTKVRLVQDQVDDLAGEVEGEGEA